MSNLDHVKEVIDSFLADKETSVLVFKGGWGVGKTYYWKKYLSGRIVEKNLPFTAYSYVSLFGLNDLKDVKSSIFHKGTPLKPDTQIESEFETSSNENSKLFKHIPWIKNIKDNTPWLGRITRFGKELPYAKQIASIIATMEYSLINNYLICFDDLERKGDSIKIKEIMGLVDELSETKKCKIVLIFNEATLSEENSDKKQFDTYREKIVDIEFEYKPSIEDNVSLVFNSDPMIAQITDIFRILNVSNIRVLKKTKWALDKIKVLISNSSQQLKDEIVKHLVVFAWSYYNKENSLPLSIVSKKMISDPWLTAVMDSKSEKTVQDKVWEGIASALALNSAEYDRHLISLLTDGFLNKDSFVEMIEQLNAEKNIEAVAIKLHNAWEIYSSTFKDNLSEFIEALKSVLDQHIDSVKLYDFSNAINILEEYGVDVKVYVTNYLDLHKDLLKRVDLEDRPFGDDIKNMQLKDGILALNKISINEQLSIDFVTEKLSTKNGWGTKDIEYLDSLTVDNIYTWMLSNPENMKRKIRSGLLLFKNLQVSNEQDGIIYKRIVEKTEAALKKISEINQFNKKRVQLIYGVYEEPNQTTDKSEAPESSHA